MAFSSTRWQSSGEASARAKKVDNRETLARYGATDAEIEFLAPQDRPVTMSTEFGNSRQGGAIQKGYKTPCPMWLLSVE
jgi:hypothetical protein